MGADTYAELADRFDRLTAARAEHQRLAVRRERLAPQLSEARGEVDRLRAVWEKEDGDVRRLQEGVSATRVWMSLRGSLDGRLGTERAEAEAAAFALQRAREQLRRLEAEDRELVTAMHGLGDVESGYEQVLAQVHRLAQEPDAGVLRERASQAGQALEIIRWRRELDEAIAAGQEVKAALEGAQELLGNASTWSTFDTFLDGGVLTSMMKHNRLDQAAVLLEEAAAAMQRFSRELADVELPGVEAPLVDSFSRGLDIWFDNFYTDLMVARRIREAKEEVDRAIEAVGQTLATLRRLRAGLP